MTENQKFFGAAFAMIGGTPILILMASLLSNAGTASQESAHHTSGASMVQSAATAQPVATTAHYSTERFYQDRHGTIISDTMAKRSLEEIRNKIRSMPDNGEKAYMEGILQAFEKEFARAKRKGSVEPIRAVDGSGKEILIGEAPLQESKRRKIFYELVQAQDTGIGDREAYTLIARKYGLPEIMLNEIAYEGAAKKWPMP